MTQLIDILQRKYPGVAFSGSPDNYNSLRRNDGEDMPPLAEIESHRASVTAEMDVELNVRNTIDSLPKSLLAIFEGLDNRTQSKWYRNGTKSGLKEALSEGKTEVAKFIIEDATTTPGEERDAQAQMLALFP